MKTTAAGNRTHALLSLAAVMFTTLVVGCHQAPQASANYMVTLPPLKMILDPLVKGRKNVACLLPPGASPHTYALSPAMAKQISDAEVLFYVDDSLDGWARSMAPGNTQSLLALVPESNRLHLEIAHDHGDDSDGGAHEWDPHFWSDPHIVSVMVPRLVEILSDEDPEGRAQYEANGEAFVRELEALDLEIAALMAQSPAAAVIAFHPSWSYFSARYGPAVNAYVEPIPGKELTPRGILKFREEFSNQNQVVVLSEVQLPPNSADALAETLSARVGVLDPLGGASPLDSYPALLRHNADRLREVLQ
jgi:zinc transport system substrate-binding protein